jgi:hypothetical protein
MEGVDHVVAAELDGQADQFVVGDLAGAETTAVLEEAAGCGSGLFGRVGQVLQNVTQERLGQGFEVDRRLAGSSQVDQALGKGELVRRDILPKENHGAPVVLKRALLVQKVEYDQRVL